MLTATRLGDGWLWLATAALLAASGNRGLRGPLRGRRVRGRRQRAARVRQGAGSAAPGPASGRKPRHFDVGPLAWFPSDRFSFPSGHALNAFAIGSVIALAFPLVAVPVLAVAASVAASRVVLGLHWLSDVLAGALVGLVIGTSVWLALRRLGLARLPGDASEVSPRGMDRPPALDLGSEAPEVLPWP